MTIADVEAVENAALRAVAAACSANAEIVRAARGETRIADELDEIADLCRRSAGQLAGATAPSPALMLLDGGAA